MTTADEAQAPPTALDLARGYAARGWRPFPIPHGSKRFEGARVRSGWATMTATTPTDKMLQLWFPESMALNIGIGMRGSGLVVIDEDTFREFDKLCADLGHEVPTTYTVRTAKGRQFYFDDPSGELTNRADVDGYDIDVRGPGGDNHGGYVVAAGSLHPDGVQYVAVDPDAPTITVPDWLAHWIRTAPSSSGAAERIEPARVNGQVELDPAFPIENADAGRRFTLEQARTYIDEQALVPLRTARPGARNTALNNAALVMGHFADAFGFGLADVVTHLEPIARAIGLPDPTTPDEIQDSIRSGFARGAKEPYARVEPVEVFDGLDENTGPDSWAPQDVGMLLDDTAEALTPSVGVVRADGHTLLYPGREHALIGEMEAGKSWFALACCAAELLAGNRVVYVHFEESDGRETVRRLHRQFLVPRDRLVADFLFVGPERRVRLGELATLSEDRDPSLVVLDGQNEAMALHGQGIRDEEGASDYRRVLVKPWTKRGAAVLSLDHVVKDQDAARGGYALGSIMKGNGLDGAMILLEGRDPFGNGRAGASCVYVTKDRPGQLRGLGRPDERVARKFFMGRILIDATGPVWSFEFVAPAPKDEEDPMWAEQREQRREREFDALVYSAVVELHAAGVDVGRNTIAGHLHANGSKVSQALTRLQLAGRVENMSVGQGQRWAPVEAIGSPIESV